MKKTLNTTELAKYIGVSRRTIYHMINDGRFPVKPLVDGARRLWSTEQVNNWLRG